MVPQSAGQAEEEAPVIGALYSRIIIWTDNGGHTHQLEDLLECCEVMSYPDMPMANKVVFWTMIDGKKVRIYEPAYNFPVKLGPLVPHGGLNVQFVIYKKL